MKKRLSNNELNNIKRLINQNYTLNQICKIQNKSKTTIYYHYNKIKGKITNQIQINNNNDILIGEFIGLYAGDGYYYKTKNYIHRIYLCFNKEKESIYVDDLIKNNLFILFNKTPYKIVRENRLIIYYNSINIKKLIDTYLEWDTNQRKTYTIRLKKKINNLEFNIGFLRGCLDSDGYVNQFKIIFSSVSKILIQDIANILSNLEIKHSIYKYKEKRTNRKDIYHIYIKKSSQNKLINIINPRNKKRNAPAEIRISGDNFMNYHHSDTRLGRPQS